MKKGENKTEEKVIYIGAVDDAQIAEWKKSKPLGIYGIIEDGRIAYFAKPNRHELNIGISAQTQEQPLAGFEEIAEATFLGGCRELLDDDKYYGPVMMAVKNEVDFNASETVKF